MEQGAAKENRPRFLSAIPFYNFIDRRDVEKSEVRVAAELVGA
jgi:hypothetical protein